MRLTEVLRKNQVLGRFNPKIRGELRFSPRNGGMGLSHFRCLGMDFQTQKAFSTTTRASTPKRDVFNKMFTNTFTKKNVAKIGFETKIFTDTVLISHYP